MKWLLHVQNDGWILVLHFDNRSERIPPSDSIVGKFDFQEIVVGNDKQMGDNVI